MKKGLYVILISLCILLPNKVLAYGCDYKTKAELKAFASNITYDYDYKMSKNKPVFTIYLHNINKEVYIVDNYNVSNEDEIEKNTYYSDKKNELIFKNRNAGTSYRFTVYGASGDCYGEVIYSFYVNIPAYNEYYSDPLCQDLEDYKLCQKWANLGISRDEWVAQMEQYRIENNLGDPDNGTDIKVPYWMEFLFDYYLILFPGIIIACIGIYYYYDKSDTFDF